MSNSLIVVGAQWGDEGKGKVIDLLTNAFKAAIMQDILWLSMVKKLFSI